MHPRSPRFELTTFASAAFVGVAISGLAIGDLVVSGAAPPGPQEWTRFRGPNGTGLSDATGIPVSWKESDFDWRVELPGEGHSQPVAWGERIFVTCAADGGKTRRLLAIRAADGSTEWTHQCELEPLRKNLRNSDASGSPAADDARVYVAFGSPASHLLLALDHSGRRVWTRDLGPYEAEHGSGNSPIVFEDLVVLGNEHDGESFVIAVERTTGDVRWKTPRRAERAAYGTPCVYSRPDGKPSLLFTSQAHGIYSLDAMTGAPQWEARVFDKRSVSSPVFGGGLAFGACGSGGGGNYVVAVKVDGEGDVTASHEAYRVTRSAPYVPTSVVKGDLLFLWAERGFVSCVELATGAEIWRERVEGSYYGSPVCVGDRLYCMTEDGEAVVVAASRTFRLLARNPIGEGSRSTPAVFGGRMVLRTYRHLLSVGKRSP